jgi:carbamoyl-phosphate synthase small subunit
MNQKNALLILEDGTVYRGTSYGKSGVSLGEICFNTGMTGYQEVFTDPSYFGQIMVTTNAHIGNYGVRASDQESGKIQIAALVCKNFTNEFSRQMASGDVDSFFKSNDVPVISDVDTRSLVKRIRSKGAMNALVACDVEDTIDDLKLRLSKAPKMDGLELASKVSTKEIYELGDPSSEFRVAVMDFGTKQNILNCLVDRGCFVRVFPAKTELENILTWSPDAFFISNGPGDPAPMDYAVNLTKQVLELKMPIFGICLGHQILALALDIPTYKMHHGHRGINHPVLNVESGKCEITSQNHGFGVSEAAIKSMSDVVSITHINLNDKTIEGIKHKSLPAFSVQYHPESSPGPHDSRYLFDEFIELIKKYKK